MHHVHSERHTKLSCSMRVRRRCSACGCECGCGCVQGASNDSPTNTLSLSLSRPLFASKYVKRRWHKRRRAHACTSSIGEEEDEACRRAEEDAAGRQVVCGFESRWCREGQGERSRSCSERLPMPRSCCATSFSASRASPTPAYYTPTSVSAHTHT